MVYLKKTDLPTFNRLKMFPVGTAAATCKELLLGLPVKHSFSHPQIVESVPGIRVAELRSRNIMTSCFATSDEATATGRGANMSGSLGHKSPQTMLAVYVILFASFL